MMSQRPAQCPASCSAVSGVGWTIRFAVVGDELERTALPVGPAERLANASTIVERVLGVPVENLPIVSARAAPHFRPGR